MRQSSKIPTLVVSMLLAGSVSANSHAVSRASVEHTNHNGMINSQGSGVVVEDVAGTVEKPRPVGSEAGSGSPLMSITCTIAHSTLC